MTQCGDPSDPNLLATDPYTGDAICQYSSPGVASGPVYSSGIKLDGEENAVTFETVCEPTKGAFLWTDLANGAFTYIPHADANGNDTVVYQVNDEYLAASAFAVITIQITATPDMSFAEHVVLQTIDGADGARNMSWIDGTRTGHSHEARECGGRGARGRRQFGERLILRDGRAYIQAR